MSVFSVPETADLEQALGGALESLRSTDAEMRPPNIQGAPGGLVYLPPSEYVVIVPDLHARGDFLRACVGARFAATTGSVEADLKAGRASVVCVGDAFHAESRAMERWKIAYDEFIRGRNSSEMNEEMSESIDVLLEIARLQSAYPGQFHFLKGNHENIANERREGNYPFRKFAHEGEMVREWVIDVFGTEIFNLIYAWEKALPIAAAGDRFLVSHAEPMQRYSPDDIVNAYLDPEVITGLTWTDNDLAEPGSVADTLETFFPGENRSRMFGGHRPVRGRYDLRQKGRYVQINTPNRRVVALVRDIEEFDPENDIVDLDRIKRH